MNDSTKKILFTVLAGLPTLMVVWIFSLYFFGCGTTNSCTGIQLPEMTSIPTLPPATLPAPKVGVEAAAAAPKCHIAALNLIGAWVTGGYTEKDPFSFTDVKGQNCTGTFKDDVQKLFVTPNLWYDGAPACITCHYADIAKATKNMDLSSYSGILAGSNRLNGAAKGNDILGGGNWDNALLHQMLYAPDGKTLIGRPPMPLGRPASVPAEGPIVSAGVPSGGAAPATTPVGNGTASPTESGTAASTAVATVTENGATATPTQSGAATTSPAVTPTENSSATTVPGATPAVAPEIARPSNPGGPGDAVNQTGDAAAGGIVFNTNCVLCHGEEGKGGIANPGSTDGTVPPLNPIDSTLANTDLKIFATNIDLFIQHGSTPEGTTPAKVMPAWGDTNALNQKQIADVLAFLIKLNTANTPVENGPLDIARPSNPGGAGLAITLKGDIKSGEQIFAQNCVVCHAAKGIGGIQNPGSTDGTVPALNPIDTTIKNADPVTFAYNIDLFVEHGSTPEGPGPALKMPAWGDAGTLVPQQIADVIAYLISLNK
jgi:mono/diheme cytochrome c family protein